MPKLDAIKKKLGLKKKAKMALAAKPLAKKSSGGATNRAGKEIQRGGNDPKGLPVSGAYRDDLDRVLDELLSRSLLVYRETNE